MRDLFTRLATRLRELFGKMERGRLVRLIVLFVLIVAVVVGSVMYLGQIKYATLYNSMNPDDAGEVYNLLREQGVEVKTERSKTTGLSSILVPEEVVDTTLIQLAEQGHPKSGLSYEIFQLGQAFGTTDIEKEFYKTTQDAENIRGTLRKFEKIQDAAVMLTPEKRSSFVIDDSAQPASAAVTLTLAEGVDSLTRKEAQTVAVIVAAAVSNLLPENVKVSDTKMNNYNLDSQSASDNASEYEKLRSETQRRLEQQIVALLTPVFGSDKVSAMVNVTLDFDSAVMESIEFSPPIEGSEEGVDVSIKELSETISGSGTVSGVTGNDPNGTAPEYQTGTTLSDGTYSRISREANRELNSVKTQLERAAGSIRDLSISVLLDSADERIQEDYTVDVTALVATALGISEQYVTVRRMPFLPVEPVETPAEPTFFDSGENIRTIITAASVIIVVLLALMMLRTMFKKAAPEPVPQLDATGQIVDFSVEEMGEGVTAEDDFDHIGGEGKSANRESIEEFISRDAESAAQLLRNWLSDGA